MDINLDQIRDEVSTWLADNWDDSLSLIEWRNRLVDSGWGMPDWPEEWYGRDLPAAGVAVVN